MASSIECIGNLATHPDMMVAFLSYAAQSAVGRDPSMPVSGGHIRGFRRFNDFWSGWVGRLSKAEIALIRRQEGDPLVDVGGNFGVFSLAMAHEHPQTNVHTFEPSPRVFAVLQENLRRNRASNVRLNRMAVSDRAGTVKFTINEESEALSRIGESVADPNAPATTLEVQAVTIDEYCESNGIERIGLLKIDVEGAEPKVLRGMRDMLRGRRIGCIYLEFCPQWLADMNESAEAVRAPLEEAGYRVHELAPDGAAGNPIDLAAVDGLTQNPKTKPLEG